MVKIFVFSDDEGRIMMDAGNWMLDTRLLFSALNFVSFLNPLCTLWLKQQTINKKQYSIFNTQYSMFT